MNLARPIWRWIFVLAALEAGAAFFILILIPHAGSSLSISRLGMLGVLMAFFVFWSYLAARPPARIKPIEHPASAVIFALLSLILVVSIFLLRYFDLRHVDTQLLLTYYERLSPLLFYLLLLSLEFSLVSLVVRYGIKTEIFREAKPSSLPALIAFGCLFIVLILTWVTRIGLVPDSAYWGEPGVPLLGWQLALVLLGGLLVLCLGLSPRNPARDWILPIGIGLLAVIIWLNVPLTVMQNSFYAPETAPTNQPFPNSDAGYYDSFSQSLLIGYPYLGNIPTRPIYIVFLALLHLLVGQRFDLIIDGQTLVLALIPVALYFIGRKLHSPAAGVMVALFAIFREWTTLLISSQTRVSNSKTLLVDLPTLLLIALACLFTLRWLERKDWKSALIAGGTFGILLLLRTQSMLILPLLFLVVILAHGRSKTRWPLSLSIFLLGFLATVVPWLIHNYLHSGQLTFDAPFQYQIVASQYKYTGNLDIQNVDLQGKSLLGILLTFALKDPKFVFGFIATHFMATQIGGILALPLIESYNGLFAPINLYWMNWAGSLSWYNLLLIVFYLGVIGLGLGATWKRLKWLGLVPLTFALGYSLANGIGRFSGWRYDLPADWVYYFYFAIGVAEIMGIFAQVLGAQKDKIYTPIFQDQARTSNWRQGLALAGAFALVGALPWMAEGIASPRYPDQTTRTLTTQLSTASAVQRLGIDQNQISLFLSQPQATVKIGRVLYPRFFFRGMGLASANPWPAFAARDYARMGFLLINQTRTDSVFPAREIPAPFPQGSDAVVLGCQHPGYTEVRLILFLDGPSALLSAPLSQPCAP
jgi:Dolichyl-phosphate-mannose-protein mannosyltransferase